MSMHQAPGGPITIAFGGDVSLSRHVNLIAANRGPAEPLSAVRELQSADLVLVNLECVTASGGERNRALSPMSYFFRGRPETLAVLSEAGVDVVTTANTHAGDYGPEALLEHREYLSAMGILAPGSGAEWASACAPVLVDVRGIVIAIFSLDTTQKESAAGADRPGTCHVSLDDLGAMRAMYYPRLLTARERAHVVLVAAHWGDDFADEPSNAKRTAGRLLIDLGADAVLGSHAHVTQGVEVHHGRPIVHDAGNLLIHFNEPRPGAIFNLQLTTDGVQRIEFVPLIAEKGWTRRPTPEEAADISATFERRSSRLGTEVRNGSIELRPVARAVPPHLESVPKPTSGPPPRPLAHPPPGAVVGAVPEDAVITPRAVGPLTLLGLRVQNRTRFLPAVIRIESFWSTEAPIDQNLLLSGAAVAAHGRWAWAETQEPCDWAWPTSRWEPGRIYRDEMTLGPPPRLRSLLGIIATAVGFGSPLSISMGVSAGEGSIGQTDIVSRVRFGPPLWLRGPVGRTR